jgi:hypothetical protein
MQLSTPPLENLVVILWFICFSSSIFLFCYLLFHFVSCLFSLFLSLWLNGYRHIQSKSRPNSYLSLVMNLISRFVMIHGNLFAFSNFGLKRISCWGPSNLYACVSSSYSWPTNLWDSLSLRDDDSCLVFVVPGSLDLFTFDFHFIRPAQI